MFALYRIEEREIVVDSSAFKFLKSEYPVNNKKIKLQKECFIITNNGIEFFLLFKYFNDDLLAQIKNVYNENLTLLGERPAGESNQNP